MGQSIATRHHLNAHAQLILHMDGLESSWEVMHARAHEPNKGILSDTFSLPPDDQLGRELRATLGEVRLELSPKIKDFILFFAKQRRSSTEAVMGMASIYNPVIYRHMAEMKMPPVLAALPAALSAFHLRAISEDGNAGLWQLNHYVAVKHGLICNATVDERRDLYKSTRAAVGHLAELHQGYGDWTMSLVAYTCGPAGIARARQRAGAKANFEQLYPFLPEGQRDYVPAFAAAAYVMTHAQKLGLRQLPMEAMPLPDRIQLQEPLRFTHVAHALGIPEDQLRNMNPVCRTEIIPGIGMPVQLCLPSGYGQRFAALKDSIYTLQQKQEAEAKRNEPKPIATSAETNETPKPEPKPVVPKPYAPPTGTVPITYTIRSGDNVGLIAQWYGITIKDLKAMNSLSSDRITAGDKLTIWVAKADLARLAKLDGMTFEQKQATVGASNTVQPMPKGEEARNTKLPTNNPSANHTLYTVKQGDNLWLISRKYPGVTPEAIMKANGVDTKLQPGMQLKIPKPAQ
jgi:membrane-bound lytic murein transglycosylase D